MRLKTAQINPSILNFLRGTSLHVVRLYRLLRHFEKNRRDLENSEIKGVETGHLSIRTTVEDP